VDRRWTRSTGPQWTEAKGVYSGLICAVDLGSGGCCGAHAAHGGGVAAPGGGTAAHASGWSAMLETELEGSDCNAGGLKTKRGRRQTQPRARGGG
jgi:hypothetical protein